MKREGTRKEERLSKPYDLWPLSPSGACLCKILENQEENVTLVPTGSLLLSLREGEISGHEDVEKLTIYLHLGSVSLCQGSQLESAP